MKKITPFLWFDDKLEEAMNFYASVFKDAEILYVRRNGKDGPVFTASFRLYDQEFMGLNAGPMYKFTPAVSFFVNCETQEEVDEYWTKLCEGGREDRCGWLTDKYGLSWQIIPKDLGRLLGHPDPEKAKRAMDAMLQMRKIEVHKLKQAVGEE